MTNTINLNNYTNNILLEDEFYILEETLDDLILEEMLKETEGVDLDD